MDTVLPGAPRGGYLSMFLSHVAFSLSLSLSLLLSLKLINICSGEDLKKKEVSSLFGHRYRSLHLLVVIQRGAVVSIYGKSNVILKVRVLQHQKKPISC